MFVGKNMCRKVESIGQTIIQAVRPRAVNAPHYMYRSRFLNDTLLETGFGVSYGEVCNCLKRMPQIQRQTQSFLRRLIYLD